MKIWMIIDVGDVKQSGFGRTKKQAQDAVCQNRAYCAGQFKQVVADGWALPPQQINIPVPAAYCLLEIGKKMRQ